MGLWRHFFEYTLTKEQLYVVVAVISFTFTASGIAAVTSFRNDMRKMSWVISFVNSLVLTVLGGVYFVIHFTDIIADGRATFHTINDAAVLISIWLCLANIFDLLFGLIFYRAHLDPLTAYVHHTLYVWITIVAAFGTGGFATFEPFAGGIAMLLIEELPTFLLATGSIFPSLRTDVGFGVTFLLFRIIFHAVMMAYHFYSGISHLTCGLYVVTMTMHMFWFFSWAKKYGVKLFKNSKSL